MEEGLCFGGGDLQFYGINSNTSANGFMKCTYKRVEVVEKQSPSKSLSPNKKQPSKLKKSDDDDDGFGDSSSEFAEDSERDDNKKEEVSTRVEFHALNPFKEFYKCTPLYNCMSQYGQNIVPLSMVGQFLNFAGNHLLHYIKSVLRKKVFYANHQVV